MLQIKLNKDQNFTIDIPESDKKILIRIVEINKNSIILGCDTPNGFKVKRIETQLNDKKYNKSLDSLNFIF